MCPYCKDDTSVVKRGWYKRPSDGLKIQRFLCHRCHRSFSENIFSINYRLRKRYLNQAVFRSLCSGVSQRACAYLFHVHRDSIARRVTRFGACAAHNLEVMRRSCKPTDRIQIDEMESFEHTKCKPLTMPIAVETDTRKILAIGVGRIAAKGHLAAISRKKYGPRPCERKKVLEKVFTQLNQCVAKWGEIGSDESKFYPSPMRRFLPNWKHIQSPGRRGCVVGQGELKAGSFDPLFTLNHTYAMIRDGLKRLARRTWCTTKRPDRLELLLNIYAWFHNLKLDSKDSRPVSLGWV